MGIKPTPLIVTQSNVNVETETSYVDSYNNISNNSPIETLLNTPEYDLLSRQPEQFAEETYRLVNFKSRNDGDRQRVYPSKKEPIHGYQTRSSEVKTVLATTTKDFAKFSKVSQYPNSSTEKKSKPRQTRTNKPVTASTIQPSKTVRESAPSTLVSSKSTSSSRKNHPNGRDNRGSSTRKSSRPKGKR